MEKFSVDGLVIKTGVTGESDRIVFILTAKRGVIRAFAKGARNTKSRLHAGTSLFAYCTFTFSENKGVFNVSEAQVKEIFFDLRNDLERLAVAQYFCEVMLKTVPDENFDPEYLRLILNSLHFLCKGKKPVLLVKSVFELRIVCFAGYMPGLVACANCGEFETDIMYFDCLSGSLYCKSCGKMKDLPDISASVVAAMRYIVFSDFEKIFSFELADEQLVRLNRLTELYLSNCFQQQFRTLEFLNETT